MAGKGAPHGNQNAKTGKVWADAIRRAVRESSDDGDFEAKLARIASGVVKAAQMGDMTAAKEVGDRLDGKPHQTIAAEVDASVTVEVVRFGAK